MQDIHLDHFSLSRVVSPRTSASGTALGSASASSSLPRQGPPSEATVVVESAYSATCPPIGESTLCSRGSIRQDDTIHTTSAPVPSPAARSARPLPREDSTLQKAHHMFFATGRRVVDLQLLSPPLPPMHQTSRTPTPASFITNPSDIVHIPRTSTKGEFAHIIINSLY